jgi:hypothetical protein
VKLPQHSLPLHYCAVEKFNHSQSFFTVFSNEPSFELASVKERASSKTVKNISFEKTAEESSDSQSSLDCESDP